MSKFEFTHEELMYLKGIKEKRTVNTADAEVVKSIFQRIDHNYNMCTTCTTAIRGETRKIMVIAEKYIGGELLDYTGEDTPTDKVYTKADFAGMTAKDILVFVTEVTGDELVMETKRKDKVIKEALIQLNKV